MSLLGSVRPTSTLYSWEGANDALEALELNIDDTTVDEATEQ